MKCIFNKDKCLRLLFLLMIVISFIYGLFKILVPKDFKIVNSNDFIQLVDKYDCSVEYGKDNFVNTSNFLEYYETKKEACPFHISYVKFDNSKSKMRIYNYFVEDVFDNSNITGQSKIDINLGLLYYNRETSGDNYKSASLYNDTILFISCPKNYREKALEIKKELGFYYEPNWSNFILLLIPLILFIVYTFLKVKDRKRK